MVMMGSWGEKFLIPQEHGSLMAASPLLVVVTHKWAGVESRMMNPRRYFR